MNKCALYLASIITMSCISFAQAKENDPLFIKQDKYDSWLLSEYYNSVSLNTVAQSSPITVEIKPYGYSISINVALDPKEKDFPATIEFDVGDFTTELKRVDQTNTYSATLDPMPSLTVINSLKENKNIILYLNNDKTVNISLNGMNKALDTMENFAKDHYIPLPPPFSSKIDVYSTMSIPNIIPFDLYPVFRQQSYFNDICKEKDDKKNKDQNKQDACKKDEILTNILKEKGFCSKENIQLPQSFMQNSKISYEWMECSKK
ncbi:unnamed protein product [Commensalibacter communis]|uniref:Uncharacterized protein n=1 Tax=Commensalibacter communis TaxID=2972786 RepID=A0A9W4TP41_9PROT|nr:hypothetical protein [Commensalibacter communis]CAI3938830.1 unnamed protein product [Commensalibacter communis]CAI3941510.1 unnamed protein product [Commensalibacter communis]CAI3944663.1 unnamed protein product [Commensalibacter communis]CAI3945133.1 unnamed protein product [Commensalibacter communis]